MPAPRSTQQFATINDVGPVVAAGVGHGHQDLAVRRQRGDGLQRLVRYVSGAEEDHPPWQARYPSSFGLLLQGLQKELVQFWPGGALLLR